MSDTDAIPVVNLDEIESEAPTVAEVASDISPELAALNDMATVPPDSQINAAFPAEDDPRVLATGSVWTVHFTSAPPREEDVARALSVLGVVRVQHVSTTGASPVLPTIE